MSRRYWLNIFLPISLLVLVGKLNFFVQPEVLSNACLSDQSPHPFLCKKRIKIAEASISELMVVHGISFKKAQAIKDFYVQYPQKSIGDVVAVNGIGPKTLEKLRQKFY